MLFWCSYCQSYQGLVEPLEDFTVTHGMCKQCKAANMLENEEANHRARTIGGVYESLRECLRRNDRAGFSKKYKESMKYSLSPVDFVHGILQPILYQVGQHWEDGKLSVDDEHYYTESCENQFSIVNDSLNETNPKENETKPLLLLSTAPGNHHTVGIRAVKMILDLHSIRSLLLTFPTQAETIIGECLHHQPRYLGISLAMSNQFPRIHELMLNLANQMGDKAPVCLVGGFALFNKTDSIHEPGVLSFSQISAFLPFLKEATPSL